MPITVEFLLSYANQNDEWKGWALTCHEVSEAHCSLIVWYVGCSYAFVVSVLHLPLPNLSIDSVRSLSHQGNLTSYHMNTT